MMGQLLEKKKLWDEAASEYRAAEPESESQVLLLADRLGAAGEVAVASRLYNDIMKSSPLRSLAVGRLLALLQEASRWDELTATCAGLLKRNEFEAMPCAGMVKTLLTNGKLDEALRLYGVLATPPYDGHSVRIGVNSVELRASAGDLSKSLRAAQRWEDLASICSFGDVDCDDVERELFRAGRTREAVLIARKRAQKGTLSPDFELSMAADLVKDLRLEDRAALKFEATIMSKNGYHLQEFLAKMSVQGKLSDVGAALVLSAPSVDLGDIRFDTSNVNLYKLVYEGYIGMFANRDVQLLGRSCLPAGLTLPQGAPVILDHPEWTLSCGTQILFVSVRGTTWGAKLGDFKFVVNEPPAKIRPLTDMTLAQVIARVPVDVKTASVERPLDEVTLGINARKTILSQHSLYDDPAAAEIGSRAFRLLMGTPMAKDGDVRTYHLTLLNQPEANAYSTAGGQIYVTSGMLAVIGNDVGLWAAAIAHEAGHVIAHHQYKQYVRQVELKLTRELLRQEATKGNTAVQWAWLISVGGGQLLNMKLNRDDELEADRLGLKMMAEAGIHPDYALRLMERLKHMTGDRSKVAAFLTSDHPRWETREKKTKQAYEEALRVFQARWKDASESPGGAPPE